jgi:hypothetical protein
VSGSSSNPTLLKGTGSRLETSISVPLKKSDVQRTVIDDRVTVDRDRNASFSSFTKKEELKDNPLSLVPRNEESYRRSFSIQILQSNGRFRQ